MRRRAIALAAGLVLAAPAVAAAAPQVTVAVEGATGANGWHTTEVRLFWTVIGATRTTGSCGLGQSVTAITADTPLTLYRCDAFAADGSFGSVVQPIKVDRTPPQVTAAPDRPPDDNGWYKRPVTVRFHGTDGMSGVEACSTVTYAGPDARSANVTGWCRDRAGLVGTTSIALPYDATAPELAAVAAQASDGVATVRWAASPDAMQVTVTRTPGRAGQASTLVYRGTGGRVADRRLRNGRTYRYVVTAVDPAGNAVSRSVTARPRSPLLAPARGARVRRPPVLRWKRARKARYYNVQLYRGKDKVLSAWPRRPRLALAKRWTYGGRSRRLRRGRYRWYVFPGYGARSERRYGPVLGTRTFRVV